MSYKCEFCNFESMNRKSLDMHKQEEHKNEKQEKENKTGKKQTPKLGNRPVKDVKIGLVTDKIIEGRVEDVTRYEIVLKSKEGSELIVLKGNIEYVEKVD